MTWDSRQLGQLTGRTLVLTGANSGIGLETARDLVGRGAHVIFAVRDVERGEQAAAGLTGTGTTSVVELDLADLDSVAQCAKTLLAERTGLSALICNAGIMGGPMRLTPQGFESQMATNHHGHAALTSAVWPLLHATGGRVVLLSSIAARGGKLTGDTTREQLVAPAPYAPQAVYSNTKQANLLFAQELHRRASRAGSPVSAVACHPGVSRSNLLPRSLGGGRLRAPVARAVSAVALQSSAAGAQPTLRALDHSTPSGAFVGPTTLGQTRGRPELIDVFATGKDPAVAARLWQLTESLLGAPLPLGDAVA